MDTREAEAEKRLEKAFEKIGLRSWHMNTTIDGFPDRIVVGLEAAFIEMKYSSEKNPRIDAIVETSQPVFWDTLEHQGFKRMYLCVATGPHPYEQYALYGTHGAIGKVLRGERLDSLPVFFRSGNADMVANYFRAVCCGE